MEKEAAEQLTLFAEEPKQLTTTRQYVEQANQLIAGAAEYISEALRNCTEEEVALVHDWALRGAESFKQFDQLTKERLLKYIKENGRIATDKGTLEIDLGDGKVQRAVVTKTTPDDKLTEQVLKANKLPLETCMFADVKYKVDMTKFGVLKDKLPQSEIYKCYKPVTYRVGKITAGGESDDD